MLVREVFKIARNDVVNVDGSLNFDKIGSFIGNIYHEKFISTEGQKAFNLTHPYEPNRIKVYVDNVVQFSPDNFIETSPNTITLSEELPAGTEVRVEIYTV